MCVCVSFAHKTLSQMPLSAAQRWLLPERENSARCRMGFWGNESTEDYFLSFWNNPQPTPDLSQLAIKPPQWSASILSCCKTQTVQPYHPAWMLGWLFHWEQSGTGTREQELPRTQRHNPVRICWELRSAAPEVYKGTFKKEINSCCPEMLFVHCLPRFLYTWLSE